jgi:nucleoside-diphosphate-sugar epimerase
MIRQRSPTIDATKMRVFITGGAGFIGSHLADFLLREGHYVSVIDDLSTGSMANISHVLGDRRFAFHRDTVLHAELVERLTAASDVVYHLAASVGVKRILEAPVETVENNIGGTALLLRLASRYKRRVVLASTSEVYGKSTQLPFREDGDLVLGSTDHSRWSYACSKAIDEFLALAWHRESALPVTVVRLFNTVGPRQSGRYGMVLPTFVRQALLGDSITVYGSGEQTRCFTHVADIVDGLAAIVRHDSTTGGIYNLGATSEISINVLAELVLAATGSLSRIVHIPYEQAYAPGFEDMPRRVPSIAKARDAFGFHPRRTLHQMLSDVIAHQRAQFYSGRAAQRAAAG